MYQPSNLGDQQDILDLTSDTAATPLSVFSEGIEIVRPSTSGVYGVVKGVNGQKSGKIKGKNKVDERESKRVGAKGKERDEGVKQSRIMREWETPMGRLRIVEQTSFDLDKVRGA